MNTLKEITICATENINLRRSCYKDQFQYFDYCYGPIENKEKLRKTLKYALERLI